MTAPFVDANILRGLVIYNPDTGDFTWKARGRKAWDTRYAGKRAGYDWAIGRVTYRSIRIFDWPFLGHRLAWLYMTGEWPSMHIDHIDGVGTNNRWSNLRLATKAQNAWNAPRPVTNTSGYKGVRKARNGRFTAFIYTAGKHIWLGSFSTAEDAHAAYVKAATERSSEFVRAA